MSCTLVHKYEELDPLIQTLAVIAIKLSFHYNVVGLQMFFISVAISTVTHNNYSSSTSS